MNLLTWISVARLGWIRGHNASTLSYLGRRHVRVDLYDLTPLRLFARSGILDVLLVVGALALTPLQALDAEFRIGNYMSAFTVGVPVGIVLLFAPMGSSTAPSRGEGQGAQRGPGRDRTGGSVSR